MIKYSIDSTLTLRETPVFRNGGRGNGDYQRNNSAKDGLKLSNVSKRKIKQYVSGYFLENDALGKNVSWVTLTVPSRIDGFDYQSWIDDTKIIKQLSKYLENLRKNHGLKNYVWVAERQDGKRNNFEHCTGAIHFHCIFDFDRFVSYSNLNLYWLKLLNEIGYNAFSKKTLFDKINEGYFSIEQTYRRYEKTTFAHVAEPLLILPEYRKMVHSVALSEYRECKRILKEQNLRKALKGIDPMTFNPLHPVVKIALNPVDIEKITIHDFQKLQTYLTKYVTKNETEIFGRVWGASRGFTSVDYEINITAKQAEELKNIEKIVVCETESTFDIGANQFTAKSTKLNFEIFKKTPVYTQLMDSILTQRLNPELPEIPAGVTDHFKFVSEAFSELRSRSYFVNDETRMTTIVYPVSSMPVNFDFDNQNDGCFQIVKKRNPKVIEFELFDFVDKDKKSLK